MNRVSSYLEEICSVIKCKEVHDEIKEEIRNHIEELSLEYIVNGHNEDEAYKLAIRDMGSPEEIGIKLNKVYERKFEYKSMSIGIILILFGTFFRTIDLGWRDASYTNILISELQVIPLILGIVLGVYYFDYRKLEKYSYHILSLAFTLNIIKIGISILQDDFGFPYGLSLNANMFILLLFLIAISGITKNIDYKNKKQIIIMVGIFIMANFSLMQLANGVCNYVFTISFIILAIKNSNKKIIPIGFSLFSIGSIIFSYINNSYIIVRVFPFLMNSNNLSPINMSISKALSSSNFIGRIGENIPDLLAPEADFTFTSIIYTLGWGPALCIGILSLIFIGLVYKSSKKIKNQYGKNIIAGITIFFGIEFVFSILMSMNLSPIMGVTLPFIGSGKEALIISVIMLGLISSIYSRKNLKKSLKKISL